MSVAYVLKSLPDSGIEIFDSKGQKLDRLITRVRLDVEPGKQPHVIVDCLDVGFDLSLDQIEFRESKSLVLQPSDSANIVAALKAFKVLLKGGDSRSAMLDAMAHLNLVKEPVAQGKRLDTLISHVSKAASTLELPDDFKDVTPALTEPKADKPLTERPTAEEVVIDPLKGVQAKR